MTNARSLFFGISLVTFASALLAAGCGESKSDPGPTGTAGASGGGGGANTATGSSRAGAAGSGGTGTNTEGNPGNVSLVDPNRDMSIPINLAESGAVSCGGGGDFCIPPSLTCCTSGAPGGMNTFSCASSASACPDGTVTSADCSSELSCGAGQVCCEVDNDEGGTTASCETACADGADQLCVDDDECAGGGVCNNGTCGPPACTADSCATGELCCRQGGFNAAAPACVVGAACPGGSQEVCADATDCPAENTCAAVGFGQNNVLVCTPPPCTPTSCGAGQECCVGAQLGGNPTCVASDPATAVCPGNSRVVCITDAECEVVPGTACLLNPQGGGSLSCRVPPPAPVGDAGTADGG